MFVCICNAIRETELRAVAQRTSGDAESVYAVLGKMPNCGQCLAEAEQILFEERLAACEPAYAA